MATLRSRQAITDRSLTVAAVCQQCDRDPAVNRARMAATVDSICASSPAVELVMFGETILGWYSLPGGSDATREYQRSVAETIPGEATNLMAQAARDHSIYLTFGMAELYEGRVYNAQVLIDPAGEIVAVHRKFHLKDDVFSPGAEPITLADIGGIKTALVICYDMQSGRVMAGLRKERPDLILLSLADDEDPGWFGARFNARLYDAWIVTANRYGDEGGHYWNGHMMVSDPLGRLRVKVKESAQVVVSKLRFAGGQPAVHLALRRGIARLSLVIHLMLNPRIVAGYVRNWRRVAQTNRDERTQ